MRQLLVFGTKEFRITIPDEAKVAFGPWSPPTERSRDFGDRTTGTLRVYASHKPGADCIFVQSGVTGYRDTSAIEYLEKTSITTGSTIWKDDEGGFVQDSKFERKHKWSAPELPETDKESK